MKVASRAWLTSFGDLLTLLLCFFVVTLQHGASLTQQKDQQIQTLNKAGLIEGDLASSSGKQVASNKLTEFPHRRLLLSADRFEPSFWKLTEQGRGELEGFSNQTEGTIKVGICEVGFDYLDSAFESVQSQLGSRSLEFLIGLEVCKGFGKEERETTKSQIILSANAKQSHG